MALMDLFRKARTKVQEMKYARFMNGYSPVFSQFGQDIYASDIVQMCIDIIATEISKLQPKHIRTDSNGMQVRVKSGLNRMFKFAPNELMTTRDFLEKIIWLLYANYNVFIYPKYEIKKDGKGFEYREYTEMYPLDPRMVVFLTDTSGRLFVEFTFSDGTKYTLPYSDVIHIRKKYSVNAVMGGGMDGQPDHQALLDVLNINHSVMQGLEKGIKTSLSIRGILKINTMMDDAKQQAERKKFEDAIANAKSGVLPIDLKGDYIPLKPDPKLIDKDTLEFLQNKVLHWYGVSLPILTGDYTDEQYQAFYEKALEPIVLGLTQGFSKTLFTRRELEFGNEIIFYEKNMMYLSTTAKLNLLKTAGEQGLLSDNQKLAILGYPPIPGGERRTMSLNYIDIDLINAYQMGKREQGGSPNE